MGVFGLPRSGKDSMIDSIRQSFAVDQLRRHGVGAEIDRAQLDAWKETLGKATRRASEIEPYSALTFRMELDSARRSRELLIFNTAGDQWIEADSSDIRGVHSFLPELDVLVITIPPEALSGLPENVQSRGEDLERLRDLMLGGIQNLREHIKASRVRRKRMVVLALTKCDRYANISSFPVQLLTPRPQRSLLGVLGSEQSQIARFIAEHGGKRYLSMAATIAKPLYLTAISGTGADDRDLPSGATAGAASGPGDRTRALDPLLYTFIRDGLGNYV
nr:hypothetical protein [Herbiconiux sp. KACC 21604]